MLLLLWMRSLKSLISNWNTISQRNLCWDCFWAVTRGVTLLWLIQFVTVELSAPGGGGSIFRKFQMTAIESSTKLQSQLCFQIWISLRVINCMRLHCSVIGLQCMSSAIKHFFNLLLHGIYRGTFVLSAVLISSSWEVSAGQIVWSLTVLWCAFMLKNWNNPHDEYDEAAKYTTSYPLLYCCLLTPANCNCFNLYALVYVLQKIFA